MDGSLRYTRTRDFGIVELGGENTFEQTRQVYERIRQLIRHDSLSGMIVVDNTTGRLSEHHVFELGEWLGRCRFPRGVRVAIIDQGRPAEKSMNAFLETVLQNRGFYNIRVFPDCRQARAWIETDHRSTASQ